MLVNSCKADHWNANQVYLALVLGCGGGAAPSAACSSRVENRVCAGDAW